MSNSALNLITTTRLAAAAGDGSIVQLVTAGTAALATTAVLGVVQNNGSAAAAGARVNIATSGQADVLCVAGLSATLLPGAPLYLSGTAGSATTDPASGVLVGTVVNAGAYTARSIVLASVQEAGAQRSGQATWPLALCRYYFVSYVNGLDSNQGSIDAVSGSTFSVAQGRAVAFKTLEQLMEVLPRQGAGRQAVVLLEGDAAASAPVSYYDKNGTTLSIVDMSGVGGYITLILRASDFTNSVADQYRCASYIKQAGPGAGGVWTVSSSTAPRITVTSATLDPTLGVLEGCAIEFTGNVTAALATQNGIVKYTESTTVLEVGLSASTAAVFPVLNDTFLITAPSVRIGAVIGKNTVQGTNVPKSAPSGLVRVPGIQLVGVEYFYVAADWGSASVSLRIGNVALSKVFVTNFNGMRFIALESIQCFGSWISELGALINTGHSFRMVGNGCSIAGLGGTVAFTNRSAMTSFVLLPLTFSGAGFQLNGLNTIGASGAPIGQKSAVFGSLFLENVRSGGGYNSNTPVLGGGFTNPADRMLIRNADPLTDTVIISDFCELRIGRIATSGGRNFMSPSGGYSRLNLSDITIEGTAPTDYFLNMRSASSPTSSGIRASNAVIIGAGVTASGTLGDVLLETGITSTWAGLTEGVITANNNQVTMVAQTVNFLRKLTVGSLANTPILGADPASVIDGDVWATNIAGVRSMCVRMGGTTYRTTLT